MNCLFDISGIYLLDIIANYMDHTMRDHGSRSGGQQGCYVPTFIVGRARRARAEPWAA